MTTTIEIEVEVEYTFDKGSPGYLSGPPESCYPAEDPSVEIIEVLYNGLDISNNLTADALKTLEEEALQHAIEEIADRQIP